MMSTLRSAQSLFVVDALGNLPPLSSALLPPAFLPLTVALGLWGPASHVSQLPPLLLSTVNDLFRHRRQLLLCDLPMFKIC
jgi:hypothetical protein